ncbi:Hint domain-containing protein [Aliiroseovarius sp.]|uniref:Hint domain-containing protein n=1 Tax=Aliiroseovarius sp. TaxID=1872442 RepID=UPI002612597D|nr:Hint domain-containing protein [Aliiroseovarius sp.]
MTMMTPTIQAGTTRSTAPETTARTGLAPGTIVLTLRGEVPVENLRGGDRVITRDKGAQTLRGVTQHFADTTTIAAGAFGRNRPERELRVSTNQPVMIRGERTSLIAARHLAGVLRDAVEQTLLYRLCFDAEHIIYADGLELTTARAA